MLWVDAFNTNQSRNWLIASGTSLLFECVGVRHQVSQSHYFFYSLLPILRKDGKMREGANFCCWCFKSLSISALLRGFKTQLYSNAKILPNHSTIQPASETSDRSEITKRSAEISASVPPLALASTSIKHQFLLYLLSSAFKLRVEKAINWVDKLHVLFLKAQHAWKSAFKRSLTLFSATPSAPQLAETLQLVHGTWKWRRCWVPWGQ